jgi:hypothetical protein
MYSFTYIRLLFLLNIWASNKEWCIRPVERSWNMLRYVPHYNHEHIKKYTVH